MLRTIVWGVVCLAGGTFIPAAAVARHLYVNNVAGDDRAAGTSSSDAEGLTGPVRSIGKALRLAGPGDRVVLANTGVPYYESLTLTGWQHRGNPVQPFVLDGQGATLDGTGPLPSEVWQPVAECVFRYRPSGRVHWNLFAEDRPLVRRPSDNPLHDLPALAEHEWCLHRGFVYFRANAARPIAGYALRHTVQETGISLYQVRDVVVQDLVIQGFRLDGVNAKNDARGVALAGLTCRGNGRSGLAVEGNSQVAVGASLLGDNAEAQILATGRADVRIERCELLDRQAPAIVISSGHVIRDGLEVRPAAAGQPR